LHAAFEANARAEVEEIFGEEGPGAAAEVLRERAAEQEGSGLRGQTGTPARRHAEQAAREAALYAQLLACIRREKSRCDQVLRQAREAGSDLSFSDRRRLARKRAALGGRFEEFELCFSTDTKQPGRRQLAEEEAEAKADLKALYSLDTLTALQEQVGESAEQAARDLRALRDPYVGRRRAERKHPALAPAVATLIVEEKREMTYGEPTPAAQDALGSEPRWLEDLKESASAEKPESDKAERLLGQWRRRRDLTVETSRLERRVVRAQTQLKHARRHLERVLPGSRAGWVLKARTRRLGEKVETLRSEKREAEQELAGVLPEKEIKKRFEELREKQRRRERRGRGDRESAPGKGESLAAALDENFWSKRAAEGSVEMVQNGPTANRSPRVSEEKQATGQEPGAEGARTDSIFASQPPSRAETSSEEESSSSEASEPAPGPGRSHRKQEQGELPGAQPEGKASSLTGREELPEEKGPSRNASEQSSEKYHGEGERAGSEPTHEERSSKERSASTQGNVGHGAGATTHRKAGKRGAREDAPGSHAPSESGTEAGTPEGRNEPATLAREEEPSSEKSEKGATPPKKTTLPSEQSAGGEEEEATATVRTTEEADDQPKDEPQEEMGSEAGGEALASSGSDEVATEKADTGVAGGEAGDTEEEDLGAPVEAEVRAQPEKEREVTPQPGTSASQETGHRIDLPDVTPPGEEAEEAGVGEIALLMRRFHEAQRWYAEASKLGGEAVGKGSLRAEQMRDAAEAKYGVPGHIEAEMQSRIIQRGGLTAAERDVLVEELADATKQAAMPALKEVRGEIRSVRNGRERQVCQIHRPQETNANAEGQGSKGEGRGRQRERRRGAISAGTGEDRRCVAPHAEA
jgi:hypothetical protein